MVPGLDSPLDAGRDILPDAPLGFERFDKFVEVGNLLMQPAFVRSDLAFEK
jgi:hypothetical protein